MVFWKKDEAGKVKGELKSIKNKIKKLKKFEDKKNKLMSIIQTIKPLIKQVEQDIKDAGEKEKRKPWIHVKFDSEIDGLVKKEIEEIDKLTNQINFIEEYLKDKNRGGISEKDLDELIILLIDESEKLQKRELENQKKINKMEGETLKERLKHKSDPSPIRTTLFGTSWMNVISVCRQLGGWVEKVKGRRHIAQIKFPHCSRPIPISGDVGDEFIANGIIKQLENIGFPSYKIPNSSTLQTAFKNGDLRRVF